MDARPQRGKQQSVYNGFGGSGDDSQVGKARRKSSQGYLQVGAAGSQLGGDRLGAAASTTVVNPAFEQPSNSDKSGSLA